MLGVVGSRHLLVRMPQLFTGVILLDALLPLLLGLLGLLVFELALGELGVVVLSADVLPEIRQNLISKLIECLFQMQGLLVYL